LRRIELGRRSAELRAALDGQHHLLAKLESHRRRMERNRNEAAFVLIFIVHNACGRVSGSAAIHRDVASRDAAPASTSATTQK
jgi:hypothetical protein